MTRRIALLADADQDARQAMLWYDTQRPGLGAEFIGAIEAPSRRLPPSPPCRYSPPPAIGRPKGLEAGDGAS